MDFGRQDANNEHFWSRPPPPRRAPQTGLQGGELGGGRHIEGWAGPANCGILIRNPLPLNSKPISCTQAIYFGRVIHGTNLTHFDADIQSLIWFASTEFAIKNLKSENGLGLCRPNESDRETDRKWGLEVGAGANLIGNVREQRIKVLRDSLRFLPSYIFIIKGTEKNKDCSKFVLKSEHDFKPFSISRHLLDYFCSKLATCLPPLLHLWTHINLSWQTSNTDS